MGLYRVTWVCIGLHRVIQGWAMEDDPQICQPEQRKSSLVFLREPRKRLGCC